MSQHMGLQVVVAATGIRAEWALKGLDALVNPQMFLQLRTCTEKHFLTIWTFVRAAPWKNNPIDHDVNCWTSTELVPPHQIPYGSLAQSGINQNNTRSIKKTKKQALPHYIKTAFTHNRFGTIQIQILHSLKFLIHVHVEYSFTMYTVKLGKLTLTHLSLSFLHISLSFLPIHFWHIGVACCSVGRKLLQPGSQTQAQMSAHTWPKCFNANDYSLWKVQFKFVTQLQAQI